MDPILLIALDGGLDINNIVNHLVQDLGHPMEEIENRQNVRPRNQNYYEIIIHQYTDLQFIEHFRMSRRTFQVCMQNIIINTKTIIS